MNSFAFALKSSSTKVAEGNTIKSKSGRLVISETLVPKHVGVI